MTRRILTTLDMANNEIHNLRIENRSGAPGSPVPGNVWFNTATGTVEFRGNSGTLNFSARSSHTGTQTASTISDLASVVKSYALSDFAAPTTDLDLGVATRKIANLKSGTNANDAVNYGQLQAAQFGTDWKDAVRAASTANVTLSGLQTIDGVSLIAGDRVLLKDQTVPNSNGIYIVAAGAWTRAADAAQGTLSANASMFIEEGTANGDSQFRLTTNNPITVGSTSLSFSQIGGATTYNAGAGLTLTGSNFALDTAIAVRKYSSNVGDGTSTNVAISHGLGTNDITVAVYQISDGADVDCDIVRTSTNIVTLGFIAAPANAALRIVVHG